MNQANLKNKIKDSAQRLGFIDCRFAQSQFLEEDAPILENWLKKKHHGKMGYMERNFDLRLNPGLIVDNAKTVITLSYNYYQNKKHQHISTSKFKISKYAYGQDYHFVIKSKLLKIVNLIKECVPNVNIRYFTDSAPILERSWAQRSGLGWIGKNANLITKKVGSYFFLSEIIMDYALQSDLQTSNHCGSCTACIDSCPTQAIIQPYTIDANKCISYLTIELKDNMPSHFEDNSHGWIFGCDICQDVCPWNRFSKPHNEPLFNPNEEILKMKPVNWLHLNRETFNRLFRNTAVKRVKYDKFINSIKAVK